MKHSRFTTIERIFVSGLLTAALMGVGPVAQAFPAVLEIADLDGTNGFAINGVANENRGYHVVSSVGNFNGDGVDDFIIGAPDSDEVYVVFGNPLGFPAGLEVSSFDGTNGFTISGGVGRLGQISNAGDVNDDGMDDLLIAADREAYVLFGSDLEFPATFDLAALDGANGFVLGASEQGSILSVSGAGDLNADGVDDLLIGAGYYNIGDYNIGGFVVFGSAVGFPASVDLTALDGDNGFFLYGIDPDGWVTVSGAGDINGDRIDDIILANPWHDGDSLQDAGRSYVVFGRDAQQFPASFNLADLNGSDGFTLDGMNAHDFTGHSVSGAGDVNADGIDDLIIGATTGLAGYRGKGIVVFGSDQGFPANLVLSELDGTNGFVVPGVESSTWMGFSVSGPGDVNGDGIDDLTINAIGTLDNNTGAGYVVFGNDQGFPAELEVSELDGTNGFVIKGVTADEQTSWSMSGAGDVNGDGVNDLIMGSFASSSNGDPGSAYIVFGERTDNTPPIIKPSITGTLGNSGWYTSDVTVSWDVMDMESEIVSTQGCDTAVVTTDTAGQTFTCVATSAGGTAQQSVTIKRDATKPDVTLTNPGDGARFTLGEQVLADWRVGDDMSGIAVSQGTVANGAPIDTVTGGGKSFEVTAIDAAGNQTTVTHGYMVETMSTVSELIGALITDIRALDLPRGIENRLVRQLQRADRDFNRGRVYRAWRRVLFVAFRVARLSGWWIAPADANDLIDSARDVLRAIRAS